MLRPCCANKPSWPHACAGRRCVGNQSQICGDISFLSLYQRVTTVQLPCLQLPGVAAPSWGSSKRLKCELVASPAGGLAPGSGDRAAGAGPGPPTQDGNETGMPPVQLHSEPGAGAPPGHRSTVPVSAPQRTGGPSSAPPAAAIGGAFGGAGAAVLLAVVAWWLLFFSEEEVAAATRASGHAARGAGGVWDGCGHTRDSQCKAKSGGGCSLGSSWALLSVLHTTAHYSHPEAAAWPFQLKPLVI